MKKFYLFTTLLFIIFYKSQNIPFDKLIGNSDQDNYSIGHYPISGSSGLLLNWYGGIRLMSQGNGLQLLNNGNFGVGTFTPKEKIDVYGNILAGSSHGTEGINAFAIRYEDGSLNNWGSLRSSAKTYMSFGVKADETIGDGWISGNGTFTFAKSAITLGSDGLQYLVSTLQNNPLNSSVSLNTVYSISPAGNMSLQGKFEAKEIKVTTSPTADFVFEDDYMLPDLKDIEKHIKENKHLPDIASAKEMQQEGVDIGEFQIKLLQKIEELTLYAIAQNKEIINLKNDNGILQKQGQKIKYIEEKMNIILLHQNKSK